MEMRQNLLFSLTENTKAQKLLLAVWKQTNIGKGNASWPDGQTRAIERFHAQGDREIGQQHWGGSFTGNGISVERREVREISLK